MSTLKIEYLRTHVGILKTMLQKVKSRNLGSNSQILIRKEPVIHHFHFHIPPLWCSETEQIELAWPMGPVISGSAASAS